MQWAVANGWACPPVAKLSTVQSMDLSAVTLVGGDFHQEKLQKELGKEGTKHAICVITKEEMEGPTVLFSSSVDGAKACAHYLTHNYGVPAVYVYGAQLPDERAEAIAAFKAGQAKVLCNCVIASIGWDYPPTTTLIMARPTRSRSFALQCWGRAARPLDGTVDFPGSTAALRREAIAKSGKPRFKIVDCTPATQDHTLVTSVDMFCTLEGEAKQRVIQAAKVAPLTAEQIAQIAAEEAARQAEAAARQAEKAASAKALEALRRATVGNATGRVAAHEVDITWRGQRNVGTYKNPLRGKYSGFKLSELPDHYLRWGSENPTLSAWIRNMFRKEMGRRNNGRLAYR